MSSMNQEVIQSGHSKSSVKEAGRFLSNWNPQNSLYQAHEVTLEGFLLGVSSEGSPRTFFHKTSRRRPASNVRDVAGPGTLADVLDAMNRQP